MVMLFITASMFFFVFVCAANKLSAVFLRTGYIFIFRQLIRFGSLIEKKARDTGHGSTGPKPRLLHNGRRPRTIHLRIL